MFRYFISLIFFITILTSGYANALTNSNNRFLNPGQSFRDRLQDSTHGPEMIIVPAGQFRMGNLQAKGPPDEHPVHPVHPVFVKKFLL